MDRKLRQKTLLEFRHRHPEIIYIDDDASLLTSTTSDASQRPILLCVQCAIEMGMPRLLLFKPKPLDPETLSEVFQPKLPTPVHAKVPVAAIKVSLSVRNVQMSDSTQTTTSSDTSGSLEEGSGDTCGSTESSEESETTNTFIVPDDDSVTVHSSATYQGDLLPAKKRKRQNDFITKYFSDTDESLSSDSTSTSTSDG